MNFSELEKLLDRANRFRKKLQIKNGEGTNWPYTFDDGETYFYSVEGVKPTEEVEDEITSMFIWLWSLRDYVKKYMVEQGKSKDWIKAQFCADPYLCICADIANSLKTWRPRSESQTMVKQKPKTWKIDIPYTSESSR